MSISISHATPSFDAIKSSPNSHVLLDFSSYNAEFRDGDGSLKNMIGNCINGDVITGYKLADLTIETEGASFLSDAVILLSNTDLNSGHTRIVPGAADDYSGVNSYSSGTVIDLTDSGSSDVTSLIDNKFLIGFYEDNDNLADATDAKITSGTFEVWGQNLTLTAGCPFVQQQLTTGQVDFDVNNLIVKTQIQMNMTDGTVLIINRTNLDDISTGKYVWTGIVDGYPESSVIISVSAGVASGFVDAIDRYWNVDTSSQSIVSVIERGFSQNKILPDGSEQLDNVFKNNFEWKLVIPTAVNKATVSCGDNPWEIDVMFVYAPTSEHTYEDIERRVQGLISYANRTYIQSNIIVSGNYLKLKLAHIAEVDYSNIDNSNHSETVERMMGNSDSKSNNMNHIPRLRNTYSADIVILLDEFKGIERKPSGFVGGSAKSINLTPQPREAYAAFTILDTMEPTFLHEVSHLFGAMHDKVTITNQCSDFSSIDKCLATSGNGDGNNNYGFTVYEREQLPDRGYYTIMAYFKPCNADSVFFNLCKQVHRFSSPSQTYIGLFVDLPLGNTEANNVNQIINAAPIVACHRDSNPPPPPPLTVTIEQAASQLDPTIDDSALFDVTFSRNFDFSNLKPTDFIVQPSGSVTTFKFAPNNLLKSFILRVSGINEGDTINVTLPALQVQDYSGNENEASTSIDNQVTYIKQPPLNVFIDHLSADPTNIDSALFVAGFSGNIDFGTLTYDDFTVTPSGEVTNIVTPNPCIDGDPCNVEFTVSNISEGDTITVSLGAGKVSASPYGNLNLDSTSFDNQVTYILNKK